ncbi:MAG: PEP/pyruvate-binding domain-containing protein, partial [Dermabacter sp.]|nr:PEP/pyruvate-binding domain-containing protein [Dermabacter sp.]
MSEQYVYPFSAGSREQVDLLGGKGANLAEMTQLGLPVPPGFTITTDTCRYYMRYGHEPSVLADQVKRELGAVEATLGRIFGDPKNPLLVSVRSGAKVSMPGMMETVLNVGLNDETLEGLAALSHSRRFALDSYRRLLQMFGRTVLDIDAELFEAVLDDAKSAAGAASDVELSEGDL